MANAYEKLRLKNIEDNRRILAEIGLVNPVSICYICEKRLINEKYGNETRTFCIDRVRKPPPLPKIY